MGDHLSLDLLSAHLDGETSAPESRRIAAHLAACPACRERLARARRLVGTLRATAPAEPPADLAARVAARIAAERPAGARRWAQALRSWSLRWFALPPSRHSFSTPLGATLAILVMALVVEHGSLPGLSGTTAARQQPEFLVSETFGAPPAVLPQTTSEVAGRVFVLSDGVWVQRGVDASDALEPQARVQARSPQGRALLAQLSGLGVLLADGSRVVLRYKLETLELSD
jgi:anti-sigma factor RsiW